MKNHLFFLAVLLLFSIFPLSMRADPTPAERVAAIQSALRNAKLDGWLFYDFHHRDPIASRVLELNGGGMGTRRWFYLIPSRGAPRKLVHRIESGALDSLPGQ